MKNRIWRRIMAAGMAVCLTAFTFGCGASSDDAEAYEDEEEYLDEDYEDYDEYYEDDESGYYEGDEDESAEEAYDDSYEVEEMGITFHIPDDYYSINGLVDFYCRDVTSGEGIYYGVMDYTGINGEDFWQKVEDESISDEDAADFDRKTVPVFAILGADRSVSPSDLVNQINAYLDMNLTEDSLGILKEVDDFCFYSYLTGSPENYENLDGEYRDDYDHLASYNDQMLANADYRRPLTGNERMIGNQVSFTTTDINGNTVTSDEIFSQNEITMINVWATWCGWCTDELPELEQINNELASMNCGIVGLCSNAMDTDTMAEAKSIIDQCGVTYPNICPYDGWENDFEISGLPTSFFVDSTGKIVTTPISGAKVGEYKNHIQDALDGNAPAAVSEKRSYKNTENAYRIIVVDETSTPVEGAMVQLCTDDTCKMALTDSTGTATFDDPPGVYEVHVRKVPNGYKENNNTYQTEPDHSDMVIVLNKE